jgi:hypothetical protein
MNKTQKKAQMIIKRLRELNFEQRGHPITDYSDEDLPEVAVENIGVPSLADCRMVAAEFGVNFRHEPMLELGVFEL